MSRSFVTLHVRETTAAALRKVLAAQLRKGASVRARIVHGRRWRSVAIEPLEDGEPLAAALSKALRAVVLSVWHWDGESRTALTLFDRGKKVGELALPEAARRVARDRVAIPLGGLSRLVGDGSRADGLELRASVERDDAEGESDEDVAYMSLEDTSRAFEKAFGLDALVYEAGELGEDEADEEALVHENPEEEAKAAAEAQAARRRAYDGRTYAVGWVAFDAKPSELSRLLGVAAAPLATAFAPYVGSFEGKSVDMKAYQSASFAPPRTARDWSRVAAALREGNMIELRSKGALVASLAIVFHDHALAVSWCFRALEDDGKRRALVATMDDVITNAVSSRACFGALLTAQLGGIVLENRAFAYEYLRQRSGAGLRPAWQREHPRGPGWRVLVPNGGSPPGRSGAGVARTKTEAGILLASEAVDPYAMSVAEMDAIERAIEGSLGRYA